MQKRVRRRRAVVGVVVLAIVVIAWTALSRLGAGPPRRQADPLCTATAPPGQATLDPAQTANAATIAAVGKREGMSDHAVTIALAAAYQESRLMNLDYGDADSVGLFQQRPSQGWGTPAQLQNPRYAAASFYQALTKVQGWPTMEVTDAAQHVQRSAAPDAYAQWEPQARLLAQVLTGEVPAGLACRFALASRSGFAAASGSEGRSGPATVTPTRALGVTMAAELGPGSVDTEVPEARGWTVAAWLVAHARSYQINEVTFAGRRWTPSSGRWEPHLPARMRVEFRRLGVRIGAELSS